MRKTAIFVLLIFLLSIAAVSAQEGDDANAKTVTQKEQKLTADQLQRRAKLQAVNKESLEKIAKLDREKQEKLESLRAEQIERLTLVKAERLAKMAKNLDTDKLNKISSLDQRQIEKLAALDRTRLKEYAKLSDDELKAKLEKLQVKKVTAFKERAIAKDKLELAKQNLEKAKERYQLAKEQLKEKKKLLLEAPDEATKIELLKEYLTNAIDTIIEKLNTLKEKISENENIDETTANTKITEIDNRIATLEELKTKITAASTLEELKVLGKDISGKWKEVKAENKVKETLILRANVQEVIRRSEHLEERLEKVLADMEEKGISAEGIESKVDSFSAKINEARELFKQSQEKFNEAKNNEEATIKEAQELAKQANERLREAHAILVDIVKDIKNAGGNAEEVEEPETEEVEIVEEVSEVEENE